MISRVNRRGSDERHCARQLEGSPAKEAIVSFVTSATTPGPAFIDVEDRIATFDNDGTLWVESHSAPVRLRVRPLGRRDQGGPVTGGPIPTCRNRIR